VSHADARYYQPTNITFGILPPVEDRTLPRPVAPDGRRMSKKEARKLAASARALAALDAWMRAHDEQPIVR
jgi:folate-dependent tRNA-U54 methylase TrmFO/GidA